MTQKTETTYATLSLEVISVTSDLGVVPVGQVTWSFLSTAYSLRNGHFTQPKPTDSL